MLSSSISVTTTSIEIVNPNSSRSTNRSRPIALETARLNGRARLTLIVANWASSFRGGGGGQNCCARSSKSWTTVMSL